MSSMTLFCYDHKWVEMPGGYRKCSFCSKEDRDTSYKISTMPACPICNSRFPHFRFRVAGYKCVCDWHEMASHEFKWTVEAPPNDNLGATEKEMREILTVGLEMFIGVQGAERW
jgi:hypothetical protein